MPKSTIQFPRPDAVAYLQGDSNYTRIHLINGQKQYHSLTLGNMISNYYRLFFRVHKSYAVNTDLIDRAATGENATVVIRIGNESVRLPVARRRRRELEALLSQALAEVEQ